MDRGELVACRQHRQLQLGCMSWCVLLVAVSVAMVSRAYATQQRHQLPGLQFALHFQWQICRVHNGTSDVGHMMLAKHISATTEIIAIQDQLPSFAMYSMFRPGGVHAGVWTDLP